MKSLSSLLLAIVIAASIAAGANAQIKNVLLEQHTGAWCGWCVDGTVRMDEILALYGEQVIGVKIHSGDAMEIPEQSLIAYTLGLTGYPTGSVNRKNFGGSVFLSRGDWKSSCESQMQQKAKAEVDCFYTLDKGTRTVRIQVMANIAESMDFPVKFNAYIVEDDVTGQGSGYDQKNNYSGRPGYEGHPYYNQPSTIVGYHHMKVVRKMIGGAWGVADGLPASVQAGDLYSCEFESGINEGWNIDNLHFVGILQANAGDNKEIINSAIAIKDGSLLNRIIDSNTPSEMALPSGTDVSKNYTLENVTNAEQTYTVTLSTTDKTPADWSAEFTSGTTGLTASGTDLATAQIVVAANSTVEFSLILKTGQTLGVGDAKVLLELEGTPTIKRSRMISAISAEIEKVLLETESSYSIRPYINTTDHNDIITLDPGSYLDFADDMNNLKLAIWNKGPSGSLSTDEIDVIKNTKNVSNFICGCYVIGGLASNNSLGYFGLEWIGWNLEAIGSSGTIWISGQQGDVITGSLGDNIRGRLIQYYINMVRITDTLNVFPIMHFQNNGIRQYGNFLFSVKAEDAIFGIRSNRNNTRTVLLGISPYVITDTGTRRTLINNIIDWLVADTTDTGTDVISEGFETGDFSKLPWERSGDGHWTIISGEKNSGTHSARAGYIEDDQTSTLAVTLDCSDGDISFYYRVSSESGYDYLRFYIDGVKQDEWSGEKDWSQVSFPVKSGTRTLEWTYSKDSSSAAGEDTAWIDDIALASESGPVDADTLTASDPFPADGGIISDSWVSLNWSAGPTAKSHDVYFSEKLADVQDGAAFVGNQTATYFVVGFPGFPCPDGLVSGTTYYWRIDEVEADGSTVHKGDVWSFTAQY